MRTYRTMKRGPATAWDFAAIREMVTTIRISTNKWTIPVKTMVSPYERCRADYMPVLAFTEFLQRTR